MKKLIIIEGTDCSGKQTQSELLVDYLNKKGIKAIRLSFPFYNSPTGKIIGGPLLGKEGYSPSVFIEGSANVDPYVSSLLYASDRKYNFNTITNYLKQGYIVVLDRYVDSNIAYQCSKIENNKEQNKLRKFIEKLEYKLLNLKKPDYVFFLHMPVWAVQELLLKRAEKPDQNELDTEYLKRAENQYFKILKTRKSDTISCVEDKKILTIHEIHLKLINKLNKILKIN